MRLRFFCVTAMVAVSLPLFAQSTPITPGSTVVPGDDTFGGTQVNSVSGTNAGGGVAYTDSVYADPNNPLCAGCYDFVIQLTNNTTEKAATSVSTTSFDGDMYTLEVADDTGTGSSSAYDASESSNGDKITFDFTDFPGGTTDDLIIYTNALGDQSGSLSITTEGITSDPAAFAPSGPIASSVTPEPSSLLLLGTGMLGFAGAMRKRLAGR